MWQGSKPEKCDLCGNKIGTEFVDGKVVSRKTHAIMCIPCFDKFGEGLGTGKGQKYARLKMFGREGFVEVVR